MKEVSIKLLIDELNSKSFEGVIYKHQLSNNVDFAQFWGAESPDLNPSNCFLIKHNEIYVGAVIYMVNDLHWYVNNEYRGNGYLTIAAKNTILPYLFEDLEKKEHRISINKDEIGDNNFVKSRSVALSIGFSQLNDVEYIIRSTDVLDYNAENRVFKGLKKEYADSINGELSNIYKKLMQIEVQLNNAFGEDKVREMSNTSLSKMASKLKFFKNVVEDLNEDFNNK